MAKLLRHKRRDSVGCTSLLDFKSSKNLFPEIQTNYKLKSAAANAPSYRASDSLFKKVILREYYS
jgi:hypothetical protein